MPPALQLDHVWSLISLCSERYECGLYVYSIYEQNTQRLVGPFHHASSTTEGNKWARASCCHTYPSLTVRAYYSFRWPVRQVHDCNAMWPQHQNPSFIAHVCFQLTKLESIHHLHPIESDFLRQLTVIQNSMCVCVLATLYITMVSKVTHLLWRGRRVQGCEHTD